MHPLSHPIMGLTLQYIHDFVRDNKKSVTLTNVVHSLATTGWALFPDIHTVADNYSDLHSDTVALFGYDPEHQVRVVDRIIAFTRRITHRAVIDIVRMQRPSEFKDMWFANNVAKQQRAKCEEVHHCPTSLIA